MANQSFDAIADPLGPVVPVRRRSANPPTGDRLVEGEHQPASCHPDGDRLLGARDDEGQHGVPATGLERQERTAVAVVDRVPGTGQKHPEVRNREIGAAAPTVHQLGQGDDRRSRFRVRAEGQAGLQARRLPAFPGDDALK